MTQLVQEESIIDGDERETNQPSKRVKVPLWTLSKMSPLKALTLSQCLYWLDGKSKSGKPRAHKPNRDLGLYTSYIWKTAAELADEIGASPKQVEKSLATLRADNWLTSKLLRCRGKGRHRGRTVCHWWLGEATLAALKTVKKVQSPRACSLLRWTMRATNRKVVPALLLSRLYFLSKWEANHAPVQSDEMKIWKERSELAEDLLVSTPQIARALSLLRDRNLVARSDNALVVKLSECRYWMERDRDDVRTSAQASDAMRENTACDMGEMHDDLGEQ